MVSSKEAVKSRKWILVAVILATMIGISSFAIANLGTTSVDTLPVGRSVDSKGNVTTVRTFQFSENCTITTTGLTVNIAKCTKHTAVMNVTGSVGQKGTIEIDGIQCFASSKPTQFRVKAETDTGLLLDVLPTGSSDISSIRAGAENEWFVQANKCGETNNTNKFKIKLIILTAVNHSFLLKMDTI